MQQPTLRLDITLPQYKCHKVVRAAKIEKIVVPPAGDSDVANLTLASLDPEMKFEVEVPVLWIEHFKPSSGGYLVQYEDGYVSFSPPEAFESGYTLLVQG